jgi:tRNA 2-selenouridine synthase
MIEDVADITPQALALYDAIIDVRSPAEFAEDHIPGALNLPVLSNEERAEVGTIYAQVSRFRARRLGAAYVARNVARHLESALATADPKFRPLLYCWRGGMRSRSMAVMLSEIGWRVGVIRGGYKTWRRAVVDSLSNDDRPLKLVLIDGETGAGKTEILRRLAANGVQSIDLEELTAHKGSVFGANPARPQPTQKQFESDLFDALRRLDEARPIAIEAESSRLGRLGLPKRLWKSMLAAPRLIIRASADARAAYLVDAYADMIASPGAVDAAIARLQPHHSRETIEEWVNLAATGRWRALAEVLMLSHYDPLYERARSRANCRMIGEIAVEALDPVGFDQAAREAAHLIATQSSLTQPKARSAEAYVKAPPSPRE